MTWKHKNSKTLKATNKQNELLEMSQTHEWILPPAEELEKLEKLCPWSMERLIIMAEKDQNYFLETNKYFFDRITFAFNLWKILGFIVFMTINSLAFYMIYEWFSEEAVITIIVELVWWLIAYFKNNKK